MRPTQPISLLTCCRWQKPPEATRSTDVEDPEQKGEAVKKMTARKPADGRYAKSVDGGPSAGIRKCCANVLWVLVLCALEIVIGILIGLLLAGLVVNLSFALDKHAVIEIRPGNYFSVIGFE